MRLRHLSEKTAFLLLGLLVLGACGKDDPEPPVPGSGEGLLRVSVRHTGDTPLAVFAYKADGSRVAGKEEPAGTPSTWSWSERLVVGEYALLIAGGFGIFIAILIQFIASPVVGVFTSDQTVIAFGSQYICGYIFDCFFAGIHFCFSGYFCAYGKSGISFSTTSLRSCACESRELT